MPDVFGYVYSVERRRPPPPDTSSPDKSVAETSWELTNASVLTVVLGRKGFLPFSVAEWDASAGSSAWVSPP